MTLDDLTDLLPPGAEPIHVVLAGASVLLLLVTLLLAGRTGRLRAAEADLARLRPLAEEVPVLRAKAERVPELEDELTDMREARDREAHQRVTVEQTLRGERQAHEGKLDELRAMKKELEDRFSTLASGVLKTNSEQFLSLVSERFNAHSRTAAEDLGKRQEAIQNLVKPLNEKLGTFDERIKEIEKARNEAYGSIRAQVQELAKGQEALGTETRRLVQALRAPKTRGRWGEMQLRQVFEMAGMSEHVDFDLEQSMETEAGRRRPDAVVRIPGGKTIVVDAKTPLEAYLDALEADGPEAQAQQLKRHAMQVRAHVKALASKGYQDQLDSTPDFIVMFIPGETFVSAAAEADPGLIDYAFENKVLIATPTTLMALVKAIAYGWQQERMAESAVEVQKLAKDLYDRLATFAGHLDKVGNALRSSTEHYNRAVGSLEARVLPTARKFEQLGVVAQEGGLEGPKAVETEPRRLTASELGGE